uniref:Uncharacterized protein n=1 Tax=Romanomermis culicivorax TaxID=13658 RepID=A0A915JTG4_ROMCU
MYNGCSMQGIKTFLMKMHIFYQMSISDNAQKFSTVQQLATAASKTQQLKMIRYKPVSNKSKSIISNDHSPSGFSPHVCTDVNGHCLKPVDDSSRSLGAKILLKPDGAPQKLQKPIYTSNAVPRGEARPDAGAGHIQGQKIVVSVAESVLTTGTHNPNAVILIVHRLQLGDVLQKFCQGTGHRAIILFGQFEY